MRNHKGLALVLVLWMLTLLSVMAGSFALTMRRETAIIAGIKNNAQARAIAEAGIAMAEWMMLNADPELRWNTDGRIYELSYADARIRVRLLSEAGKIDINKADEAQLQALISYIEEDALKQIQIVDAILDWRDEDDLVNNNGAEKNEYQAAGLRYGPANKAFQSIDELQMVLGVDATIFNHLEPLVTVYSNQQLDLQKASREVLQALGGETPFENNENNKDSSDDQLADQNNPFAMAARQATQQPGTSGTNEVVTIISEVLIAEDRGTTLKAVVKKSSGGVQPFQILNWKTDAASHDSLFAEGMDELLNTEYAESRLNN